MKRIGVVGGGVIGLATAWYLARKGADPIVVDAGPMGAGCSAGNAGWVCPSISTPLPSPALTGKALLGMMKPGSPLYIKPKALPGLQPWLRRFRAHCTEADYRHGLGALAALNRDTARLYEEMTDEGVDFEYGRTGILQAFRDPAKLEAAELDLRHTSALTGGSYDVLDAAGVREREPMLKGGFKGGILVDTDGHVRPESLTAGLAEDLRRRGVELRENEPVRSLEWDGDRIQGLITERSTIVVDAVVLAAGAETGTLAAAAGISLPLTAGKGYSVTIAGPRRQLRQPLYLVEAKLGLTPFDGSLRIAGTMELSGLNRDLDRRRIKAIRRVADRDVDIEEAREGGREWVGMRPMVPDTLPVLGSVPGRVNVYLATGHQMLGVTLAASSGQALASLIVEGTSPVDLAPFSPARF